jgi:hypothetical protein
MNEFEKQLKENIIKRIAKARKNGITAMSLDCLMQNIETPSQFLKGAPKGPNAPYYYKQLFREVCLSNSDISLFIIPSEI